MSETNSGEQFSLSAFKDELKDALQKPRQSKIPLYIAALAALLSIASLADTEMDKIAMSAHIESSNKFAYFQAKSIRGTDSKIAAQMFEKMNAPSLAAFWQQKADRYGAEKSQILKEARQQQKIRTVALKRGNYYKVGATLLQIAIVLASASLVLGGGMLFALSLLLTLVSIVYSLNGYGMFFDIPTSPEAIVDWSNGLIQQMKKSLAEL